MWRVFMVLKKKLQELFTAAQSSDSSAEHRARSFSTGIFIAFSPFLGGHTIMMLACKWLFSLHFPLLFFSTALNNPWTMIPFYTLDYLFGRWLVHSVLGLNPSWQISLEKIFGSGSICLWSFLIGGTVLGIVAALISYLITVRIFRNFDSHEHK